LALLQLCSLALLGLGYGEQVREPLLGQQVLPVPLVRLVLQQAA
jgi:hypothetical protein